MTQRLRALQRGAGVLTPHKEALLGYTARLMVHLENMSNRVIREQGEFRQEDGEPKVAMKLILDYFQRIEGAIKYIFPDDDDGVPDLSKLLESRDEKPES